MTRTRRSTHVERRRAVVKTWQPNGRIERTLTTKWLTVSTPARFIQAAAALVPRWQPRRVHLSLFDSSAGEAASAALVLNFGHDEKGESTSVSVTLEERDVNTLLAYMLATDMITAVTVFGDLRPNVEGDGGEELPVPAVSASALAMMQAPAGVH